jgi:hypothetical protein
VAINHGDPPERVREYVERGKFAFPIALGGADGEAGVFKDYQVNAYPTNFLIDGQGKIAGRWVGYDEPTMAEIRAALARLGL